MKKLFFLCAFAATTALTAQTTPASSNVPNTGANTTPPAPQTFSTPADNMANPSNSTVPGASGSYSVEPGKPALQNPGTNGSYTTYPSQPQPVITPSTQSSSTENRKKKN
ncbi:hypothetical protein CNR22_14080 [Sphingobacteriaceae bacterium]|nr:hypothetical protein CNR22_14080 [Sphingobacteriaceae bacterium]